MKNLKNFFLLILSAAVLTLTGCAKDGETGPAGPAGKDGTNGVGQDGQDGQDGNANVQHFSFQVNPGDWSTYGSAGTTGHALYYEKSISQITQDILDNGLVMTYLVTGNYNLAMPTVIYTPSYQVQYLFAATVGTLEIDIQLSTLQTPTVSGSFNFKCVVIDGTVRAMNPDLDWHNYDQVKNRLGLQD